MLGTLEPRTCPRVVVRPAQNKDLARTGVGQAQLPPTAPHLHYFFLPGEKLFILRLSLGLSKNISVLARKLRKLHAHYR